MELNKQRQQRYLRHIALEGIGAVGQKLLLDSKVIVIGCGGLGSPLLLYLAAAGVGNLAVVDDDKVSLDNLQRQIIFNSSDIGYSKVAQASKVVSSLNDDVSFRYYNERITENNIENIIKDYDIVVDATDNFTTRFLINKYSVKLAKTLVWAAVNGFVGQVGLVKFIGNNNTPCFECFCSSKIVEENNLPDCISGGVLGSIVGVVGSLQATEVIKEILDIKESLAGNILIYNGLSSKVRKVKLNHNSKCLICQDINV